MLKHIGNHRLTTKKQMMAITRAVVSQDMSRFRDSIFGNFDLEGLKSWSWFRLSTLKSRKIGMSRTSGTTAIFLRFCLTAAVYGRFYSLSSSASGRMRSLSFYMNFEKKKCGRDRLPRAHPHSTRETTGDR